MMSEMSLKRIYGWNWLHSCKWKHKKKKNSKKGIEAKRRERKRDRENIKYKEKEDKKSVVNCDGNATKYDGLRDWCN